MRLFLGGDEITEVRNAIEDHRLAVVWASLRLPTGFRGLAEPDDSAFSAGLQRGNYSASLFSCHIFRCPRGPCFAQDQSSMTAPA